jgi:restriction system protein
LLVPNVEPESAPGISPDHLSALKSGQGSAGARFCISVVVGWRHGQVETHQRPSRHVHVTLIWRIAMSSHGIWLFFVALIPLLIVLVLLRPTLLKGKLGESKVNFSIGLLLNRRVYRLIKNVTLPVGSGTTQIDHIVVSPYGIFVIETKNMKGWIFGDSHEANWTQVIYRRKERFQNPLRQNYKHVKVVQDLLNLEPRQVFNVVVFVGDCTFKTQMPREVVKGTFGLSKFIKSKRVPVIPDHELPDIFAKLLDQRLVPGLRTNRAHIRNVRNQTNRKRTEANICPRCGAELVERTNQFSGEKFLGCSRYPRCKGTRSLPFSGNQ